MSTRSGRNFGVCGFIIGTGYTGLPFHQDIGYSDKSIVITSVLENGLHLRNRKMPASSRRTGLSSYMFISDKELNSKFLYLHYLVSGNVSDVLQQFHIDIYKNHQGDVRYDEKPFIGMEFNHTDWRDYYYLERHRTMLD
ncbi:unnamed protein product [Allacma fusca]|uniref:Uncharacterized protein n=1 Tax=Allacma fusca TaxID=39272 RepID=A0A8J2JLQ9_9HEXA|nr:unnamed protein product [Allacma fusca]